MPHGGPCRMRTALGPRRTATGQAERSSIQKIRIYASPTDLPRDSVLKLFEPVGSDRPTYAARSAAAGINGVGRRNDTLQRANDRPATDLVWRQRPNAHPTERRLESDYVLLFFSRFSRFLTI
jgi:hypothetical protein